ncbi:ATP-binding cassette domain-containing protein [Candidatus Woesearchaeota archaeon]|nr:ATP-binding cassette domain-containing protein [Candidatus Woesearchaeota archaeon]
MTLNIDGLTVVVEENRKVLDEFSISLDDGSVAIIFGPNGTGKSTLLSAIGGMITPQKGSIIFDGHELLDLSPDKRSKLGIGFAFQNPPEIIGVKLRDIFKICLKKKLDEPFSEDEFEMIKEFDLERFLDRDVNHNFSGGEKKRAEILQMLFLKPKLLLLDEPDSGVDVESLNLIGRAINAYIQETGASAIIITHHGDMFNYIESDIAYVLLDGKIRCCGNPCKVFNRITKDGYSGCRGCDCDVE